MSNLESQTKPDGGASESTVGLGDREGAMSIEAALKWVEENCTGAETLERLRSRRVAKTLADEVDRLRSALGWLVIPRTDWAVKLNQDPQALEMAGKLIKTPNAEITGG